MAKGAVVETGALTPAKASGLHEIDRLVLGYRGAKALFTAAALDVFTPLAAGPADLTVLCRRLKTKTRPTEVLLDALVALGFLEKNFGAYSNAPLADRCLVRGRDGFIGDNLRYQDIAWDCWGHLGALLRTGRTRRNIWTLLEGSPAFADSYIRGMDNIAWGPAREIAARLDLGPGPKLLLDVGAGPGAYTRALLERNPQWTAVLLDLPSSLRIAKQVFSGSLLRPRIILKAGNYHTAPFGRGCYDLIIFSHITHNEVEEDNRRLVCKAADALRTGGTLMIHDFTVQGDGAGPLFAALLALHMLSTTGRGRIYSREVYGSWMRDAGLDNITTWPVSSRLENSTWVITGTKSR